MTIFAITATITPGPNNLMVAVSGANYGFRRTIPHILGIAAGFTIMLIAVGLGLAQIFATYPWVQQVLKYASLIFLLYLAYKMGRARAPTPAADSSIKKSFLISTGKPVNFFQAALFQWVNPKAWLMILGAVSTFTTQESLFSVGLLTVVFLIVCFPCNALWAGFGVMLSRFLTGNRLRVFNWSMAILMIASVLPFIIWKS